MTEIVKSITKNPAVPQVRPEEPKDGTLVRFIKKSNDLVEARYKFDIWETRLFTRIKMMMSYLV